MPNITFKETNLGSFISLIAVVEAVISYTFLINIRRLALKD